MGFALKTIPTTKPYNVTQSPYDYQQSIDFPSIMADPLCCTIFLLTSDPSHDHLLPSNLIIVTFIVVVVLLICYNLQFTTMFHVSLS